MKLGLLSSSKFYVGSLLVGSVLVGGLPTQNGNTETTGLGIGQSLMVGHTSSQESGSDGGEVAMLAKLTELVPSQTHSFVNSAVGGSYILQKSEPTSSNYWMNDDLTPNTLATDAVADVQASGKTLEYIIDGQGEADSFRIPTNTTEAEYKAAKLALYSYLRTQLGDVPVFIQRNPARRVTSNSTGQGGANIIRKVYSELVAENSWIFDAGELYDLTLTDSVHLDDVSYVTLGERNAQAIAAQLHGVDTFWHGPTISDVQRQDLSTSVRLWVSISQEGSTTYENDPQSSVNIAPASSNISQFIVLVDGVEVVPDGYIIFVSNGSSRDQNIRLTFNDKTIIPSTSVVELYNFFGNGVNVSTDETVDLGKIIHDSNGLPVRTSHWIEDTSGAWSEIAS